MGLQSTGLQSTFHAPLGSADFLGWRTTRSGATEIVYDNAACRMVWRVAETGGEERIVDVLRLAVCAPRVLPTLYDELKKRAIGIERVGI